MASKAARRSSRRTRARSRSPRSHRRPTRPERVIGLHFFNPAPVMRLVEVVAGPRTAPSGRRAAERPRRVLGQRRRCAPRIGPVSSSTASTGRSRSRRCGCSRRARQASRRSTRAIRGAGYPIGPFELMDLTGDRRDDRGRDRDLGGARAAGSAPAVADPGGAGRRGAPRPKDGRRVLSVRGRAPAPAISPRFAAGDGAAVADGAIRDRILGAIDARPASPSRGRRLRGRHRSRHAARRQPSGRAVRARPGLNRLSGAAARRPDLPGSHPTIEPMTRDLHRPLREAWVVEAVRTPIGRYGGALAAVRPDDLAAAAIRAVVERSGIDPALIEDVILGCANQAGEDNRDVARMALLLAGLPVEVGGLTVNRLCGSGLQAINSAAHAIAVGDGDVFIGGGVESMTRAPYVMAKPAGGLGPRPARAARTRRSAGASSTRRSPSCTTRTRWARPPRTSPSAGRSTASARTRSPSPRSRRRSRRSRPAGSTTRSSRSRSRRRRATRSSSRATSIPAPTRPPRRWRRLRPAFREGGSVTAGNSSGINDGASAVLLVEAERARELGPQAAGPDRLDGGRRRRPGDHGLRPGAGDAQGARAGRDRRRRPRPRRAQRGVRLASRSSASTSSGSTRRRSTSTAARSRWATRSG